MSLSATSDRPTVGAVVTTTSIPAAAAAAAKGRRVVPLLQRQRRRAPGGSLGVKLLIDVEEIGGAVGPLARVLRYYAELHRVAKTTGGLD